MNGRTLEENGPHNKRRPNVWTENATANIFCSSTVQYSALTREGGEGRACYSTGLFSVPYVIATCTVRRIGDIGCLQCTVLRTALRADRWPRGHLRK